MQQTSQNTAPPGPGARPPPPGRQAIETRPNTRRPSLQAAFVALFSAASLLAGCAGKSDLRPFPDDWSPPTARLIEECPDLRGSYHVLGSEVGLRDACAHGASDAGAWNCSRRLDEQLRFDDPLPTIAIDQPDADTIVFAGRNVQGRLVDKRFTRSAGDFGCDRGRLVFTARGSLFSDERTDAGEDALATAGGLLLLRGGVRTMERALSVSSDGALLMNITVTNTGLLFPIPFRAAFSAWVRWQAVPTSPPIPDGRPLQQAP